MEKQKKILVELKLSEDILDLFQVYCPGFRSEVRDTVNKFLIDSVLHKAIEAWQKNPEKLKGKIEVDVIK